MATRHRENSGRIVTGEPDIDPATPSHVPGVQEGNAVGRLDKEPGLIPRGPWRLEANARRSTGINPEGAEAISPDMPRLTPA